MKTLTNRLSGLVLIGAIMVSLLGFTPASAQYNVDLGSGTSTMTWSTTENPITSYWRSTRTQFIYTASEISTAGGSTSDIDALGLYIAFGGSYSIGNYTIKMKNTSLSVLNSTWQSGTSTVKNAHTHNPSGTGYDMVTFDNLFNWDGTSNLLIEFCHQSSGCCSSAGKTIRRYFRGTYTGTAQYTTGAINYCNTTLFAFNRTYAPQLRLHFTGKFIPPPAPTADVISGPADGISMEAHTWATTTLGSGQSQHWEYKFNAGTWQNLNASGGDPTPTIVTNVPVADATFYLRSHRTASGHSDAVSNVVSMYVECAYLFSGTNPSAVYGIRRFKVDGPPPVPGIPTPNVTLLDKSSTRHSMGGLVQDWKAATAASHPATPVVAAFPVRRGGSYLFGIGTQNATWTHGRVVWVDYNNDGDFSDAGENVLAPTPQQGGMIYHPVQISCTAAPGTKAVRIRADRFQAPYAAPCLTSSNLFGELEEYEMVVLPPSFDVPPIAATVGDITMDGETGRTEWWNTEAISIDVTSYTGNVQVFAAVNGGAYGLVSSCVNVNLRTVNFVNGGTADIRVIVSPLGCTNLPPVTADLHLDVLCVNNFTYGYPCTSIASYLSRVKLANVDNVTTCKSGPNSCLGPPPAFWGGNLYFGNVEDFYDDASLEIEICANARYIMKLQTGSPFYNQGISGWMDFNGDGSFNSTDENIFDLAATTSDPQQVRNVLLSIPSGGIGNSFRMLITNQYNANVGAVACGNFFFFGSHEIYKVTVIDEAPPVTISSTDDDNIICEKESITFTADGGGNVSAIQWYHDLQEIPGANGTSYTIASAELDDAGQYLAEFSFTTGCANTTIETFLTVNPVPVIIRMEANPPEACCGSDLTLSVIAKAGGTGGAVIVGAGLAGGWLRIPYSPWQSFRNQNIYRASDLAAAGLSPGRIDFLQYDVNFVGSTTPLLDWEMAIGHTTLNSFPSAVYSTGLTTVLGPTSNYVPSFGINKHDLSAPFIWNGVDNLVIESCGRRSAFFAGDYGVKYDTQGSLLYWAYFNNLGCSNNAPVPAQSFTPQTGFGRYQTLVYEWNTGQNGAIINVNADCGASTQTNSYIVTVTNAETGCQTVSDPIDVVIQPNYGLLATNGDMYIGPRAQVINGSAGSSEIGFKTRIKNDVRIADGFAAGDSTTLAPGARVNEIIYGRGYRGTAGSINQEPWPLSINLPDMPAIPGGANMNIANYKTLTLSPGDYGKLRGGSYNRIELEPGVYTFTSIYMNSHSQFVSTTGEPNDVEVFVAGDVRFKNKNNEIAVFLMADGEVELGPHNVYSGKLIGGSVVVKNDASISSDGGCWPEIILPDPQPVYNVDYCDSAQLMVCGDVFTGSTLGAINDGIGLPACGSAFLPGRDNWYLVEGTGQVMTVTTCHPTLGFDTNIQVWRDTGGGQGLGCNLRCVGGNDDMGFLCSIGPPTQSFRSQVVWSSVPFDQYKIRVSGFGGIVGAYGLTLTCTPKDDATEDELALLNNASTGVTVFPNPLSTSTTFDFNVGEGGNASLEVFSIAGSKVATLFKGNVESGSHHTVDMDASELAPGVYFYNLTIGSEAVHGKITVAK